MIETGTHLPLIETLAFPVASHGPEGRLRAANMPFHGLMDVLLPDTALSLDLRMLGDSLGTRLHEQAAGAPVEVVGHRAMIAEVRQLRNRLTAFTPRLGDDLHRFLSGWLMQHILVEDRQYVPYLSPTEGKDR